MGHRRRARRLLSAVALVVLLAGAPQALAAPVSDDVTQDDIERARQAEQGTSATIAALEIQLASLSVALDESAQAAQVAAEAYLQAQESLADAQRVAEEAAAQAETARAERERQRGEIGRIATTAYRSTSTRLGPVEPLLGAESFTEVMTRATTLERMGRQADDALQRFQAADEVAATFERRAAEAEDAQQQAADELADAADAAQASADAAQEQLELAAGQREALIVELAGQRQTTAELERQRQDQLEAERRQRLDEQARQRVLAELESGSSGTGSRPDSVSRSNRESGSTPEATPEATSAPEPTTPAPTASPTPTPRPTAAPSPSPTPSSSPTPSPSPSPSPTPSLSPTPSPSPSPTPTPTPVTPPAQSSAAQQALSFALGEVGKPYVWGAAGPDGYDCSGLTQTAFASAGVSIPRTTRAQYDASARVPVDQLQPGDLIFYSSNGQASGIYHVAIYAGNGMRVHAPSPGKNVEHVAMYWTNVLPYGGRL